MRSKPSGKPSRKTTCQHRVIVDEPPQCKRCGAWVCATCRVELKNPVGMCSACESEVARPEVVMTASEIRAVARKLTKERERMETMLREHAGNAFFGQHEWIAMKGIVDGMLRASGTYLEALVAKEKATQEKIG